MWISVIFGLLLSDLLNAVTFSLNLDDKNQISPARLKFDNCIVGNATFTHGETFKLDCKTQCVCEDGRHACSTLCPKENLTPPRDTRLCHSPKLVEITGHCCKVWLCDKAKEDVNATCQHTSTSPWSDCSEPCGVGLSTRQTETTVGCEQLSSMRLCQNRRCDFQPHSLPLQIKFNGGNNNRVHHALSLSDASSPLTAEAAAAASDTIPAEINDNLLNDNALYEVHKVRKGHECRNIQRIGSSRIRLGPCVSRKLYRPKICGRCQNSKKCCVPSVSTTIQVEMLCPLNSGDPLNFIETKYDMWDSNFINPIDQELLQSRHIQIENRFIAVQWVLKCDCSYRGKECMESSSNEYDEDNFEVDGDGDADDDAADNTDLQELLKRVHRT